MLVPGQIAAILAAHAQWLAGAGGQRADFTGADLTSAGLQGQDLRQVIFTRSNLTGADLQTANLAQANLEGANLQRANLRQADLTDAIVQPAVLPDQKLQPASLQNADLTGANLQRAVLQAATLDGANLDGSDLRDAYLEGARLVQASLVQANLEGAVLWEADLEAANLETARLVRARLEGAHLAEAVLRNAVLNEARLQGANLHGANLEGATLQQTNLTGASLVAAHLSGVDLTQVSGLVEGALGGAALEGARLPAGVDQFEGLKNVAEAAKNAGTLFVSMLTGCAYSWVVIATTTDAALLNNSGPARLPLIDLTIPVDAFYAVAPLVLVAFSVYFHLYLQRLWELLTDLPAVFPEGTPLDKRVYPWAMNGLIHAHMPRLQDRGHPPLMPLQNIVSRFFAWWLVPIILLLFWGKFIRAHHFWVTEEHALLLGLAVGMSLYYRHLTGLTLMGYGEPRPGSSEGEQRRLSLRRRALLNRLVATASGVLLLAGLSAAAIRWPISGAWPARTVVDLRDAEVSTKPASWTGKAEAGLRRQGPLPEEEIALIRKAYLKGKDLRRALASRALFIRADLRDADLSEAIMDEANLREANLRGARLRGATLWSVDLQGADLRRADLQGADLHRADLRDANLQGAVLGPSPRSDLLAGALYDSGTHWPEGFEVERYPALRVEPEMDLRRKELSGLDLRDADLRGARLEGVNLRGANLREVLLGELPGAVARPRSDFLKGALYDRRTRWRQGFPFRAHSLLFIGPDTSLTRVDLRRRDLAAADLRRAHLRGADLRGRAYGARTCEGRTCRALPYTAPT